MDRTTYDVEVERRGKYWAGLQVIAGCPMQACEIAERIVCQAADGNLNDLTDYFARSAKPAA
jgi:hypothetical protein